MQAAGAARAKALLRGYNLEHKAASHGPRPEAAGRPGSGEKGRERPGPTSHTGTVGRRSSLAFPRLHLWRQSGVDRVEKFKRKGWWGDAVSEAD